MLNNNKLLFLVLFFVNFLLLLSLQLVFSINIDSLPIDHKLANSNQMKIFLILLIIIGQLMLIVRLTKLKISTNLQYYSLPKQYIGYSIFLLRTQHHPDCSCFKDHEISIKNHKICSGCYGSSLGMLLGIIVLISSFIIKMPFFFYYYFGIILIQIALIKFMFASYTRLILNAFFPLGINFLLASSLVNDNAVVYLLLFIPVLLLELAFRLFIADVDNKVDVCPEGLSH